MQLVQKPVGDLKVLFEYLKSKIFLGVATNDNEIPCKSQLEKERIIKYLILLQVLIVAMDLNQKLGNLKLLQIVKFKPSEVAMIGDSTHD